MLRNGWTGAPGPRRPDEEPRVPAEEHDDAGQGGRTGHRAYRNVLGRDPDPAGLEGYVQGVLRKKWTEADVERELRKSDEYRNKR